MKKKQLNKVLSLRKETVSDLTLFELDNAKGGIDTRLTNCYCDLTNKPAWTCYFPTYCYPSPYTDCSPGCTSPTVCDC